MATAAVAPASKRRFHCRTTLGWMSSSRETSARVFALQQLLNDTALELHGKDASAVRLPWKLAHEALPSCRSRIAPSVSSSIGRADHGDARLIHPLDLYVGACHLQWCGAAGPLPTRQWSRPGDHRIDKTVSNFEQTSESD